MPSGMPDPNQQAHTPPTTPEEALAIFHSRYAQPKLADGSPAELVVHEFDEGFLIYPVLPPVEQPEGSPARPAEPGGGKIVVSKETGKSYGTPNFPTEQAIALYKKNRARERNA
ncbi:hypothetical protein RCO28_31685 [Streptomyces sp. LHD-70]|uniref:hypothetical protein n=1 Tax=Streptomyces sp. LHD-70 TaxID=3072140 RepID=UPI00280C46F8|nr:hypothetical protein [Streptomyces sp. LHD-70]MDQ8707001.1 hypothetical protein [Streptomyces sp. LHD-70]